MDKQTAELSWNLWAKCPNCNEDNDLARPNHDTENSIALAIFNNKWDDLKGWEITCESCSHGFKIREIIY